MEYGRQTGPRDRTLRAADADREAVAEVLRREHLAGRLDGAELGDRLDACFAAVTYADLDALVADLPGEEQSAGSGRVRGPVRWPLPLLLLPLFAVAVVVSHGHALWLLVPLTLFAYVRGIGPFGGRGWACGPRGRRT